MQQLSDKNLQRKDRVFLEVERVQFTAAYVALSSHAGVSRTDVFLYRSP